MEGYRYEYVHAGEDVVVLAGDIHTRGRHEEIIDQIPETTQIVMVAGNHEYYHSEFHTINSYLKNLESELSNFRFLNNDSITINGIHFYGGTMYSDLKLNGEVGFLATKADTQKYIADFRVTTIEGEDGKWRGWSVDDHLKEHTKFCDGLQFWLKETEGQKRVVISHFVPHRQAIHPRWGVSALNGYFTCDMDRYMGWEGKWLFGHTHDSSNFMVGDTHCICNPRGYGSENSGGFVDNMIIDI